MLQTPGDDVFDRITDFIPRRVEGFGRFLPRELAGPAGQEQHVSPGQLVLAVTPGDFFDHNTAAAATVDAPQAIQQEDQKAPERKEREAPLRKMIVAGSWLVTARAD